MKGIFITGTDTGVGKTYFTALLVRTLRAQGIAAIALKPVATGDRADALALAEAMGGAWPISKINPVHFSAPLAPYAAGMLENRPFPWDHLRSHWRDISKSFAGPFLVEGIGGWRVPMDSTHTVREWAQELGLPVLVLCRATLGTLNHTLLTVDSIRQTGLLLPGIVMNFHSAPEDEATHTNPVILEEWSQLPVARLPAGATAWEIPGWLRSVLV
jgi:dethiobiotin synthetase